MNQKSILIGVAVSAAVVIALGIAGGSRMSGARPSGAETPPVAYSAASAASPRALLAQAELARAQGSPAEAKRLYQQALQESSDAQTAASAQEQLGKTNIALYFSPSIGSGDASYTVQPGDNLTKIARKAGTTIELLRVSNGIQGDRIRAGQKLKLPKAAFSVLVDKSQNTLTLKDGEEVVKVYRCSTGRDGITPVGTFRVVNRIVDPVWKGIVPPGDPQNPLGTRWMGFDLPQYGIHGTNEPQTIGQAVTDGCVRLANNDAEELFTLLPEGTAVTVVE